SFKRGAVLRVLGRKAEGMAEDERHATFDECFEYNDHLRANGHLVAEVPLQPPETALTLYWKNGKVATTDGPYAETDEQLGGWPIPRRLECFKDASSDILEGSRISAQTRSPTQASDRGIRAPRGIPCKRSPGRHQYK